MEENKENVQNTQSEPIKPETYNMNQPAQPVAPTKKSSPLGLILLVVVVLAVGLGAGYILFGHDNKPGDNGGSDGGTEVSADYQKILDNLEYHDESRNGKVITIYKITPKDSDYTYYSTEKAADSNNKEAGKITCFTNKCEIEEIGKRFE